MHALHRLTVVLSVCSAHYYSTPDGRDEFKDTIGIIKGVARSMKRVNGDMKSIKGDILDADICSFTGMNTHELEERRTGNIFMTQILYGRDDGWFDQKHRHLRHVPAHREDI
jgi:hypothetical protein